VLADATAWGADLIVMATHGRCGLQRLALGSHAEALLRTSPLPVLLVREADV
jgi:nucleotide-binding universal stress UspA family protein